MFKHMRTLTHAIHITYMVGCRVQFFTWRPDRERVGVIYEFHCKEDGCQASYFGHTRNSLATRARPHRHNTSSIHNHYQFDHHLPPPTATNFVYDHFTVLQSFNNPIDLRIAEALYIKQKIIRNSDAYCCINQ